MASSGVSTKSTTIRRKGGRRPGFRGKLWLVPVVLLMVGLVALGAVAVVNDGRAPKEPPELARVLKAQESMDRFGILIPGYLPRQFDRKDVNIEVSSAGPVGEPSAKLSYLAGNDDGLFIQQWVPVNRDMEILSGSRPVETKWGKGYLLTQTTSLIALWVDIGELRVSLSTSNLDLISRDKLVYIAESLGLPSSVQSFTYATNVQAVKDMPAPPPFEVAVNSQGVQELNLTITPGGYSPMRIAVKKGIPVKINYRKLGQVGCGEVTLFPADPDNPTALSVKSDSDVQVLEFTPQYAGDFRFECASDHYRGIMTVREN